MACSSQGGYCSNIPSSALVNSAIYQRTKTFRSWVAVQFTIDLMFPTSSRSFPNIYEAPSLYIDTQFPNARFFSVCQSTNWIIINQIIKVYFTEFMHKGLNNNLEKPVALNRRKCYINCIPVVHSWVLTKILGGKFTTILSTNTIIKSAFPVMQCFINSN